MNHKALLAAALAVPLCLTSLAGSCDGYTRVNRAEPTPIAGLKNADFEDSTKYSLIKDPDVECGRFGYNGNGGCRLKMKGKFHLLRFPSDCKLKKGHTYTFSGSYRKTGSRIGGGFAWMLFVDGKYRTEKGRVRVHNDFIGDFFEKENACEIDAKELGALKTSVCGNTTFADGRAVYSAGLMACDVLT